MLANEDISLERRRAKTFKANGKHYVLISDCRLLNVWVQKVMHNYFSRSRNPLSHFLSCLRYEEWRKNLAKLFNYEIYIITIKWMPKTLSVLNTANLLVISVSASNLLRKCNSLGLPYNLRVSLQKSLCFQLSTEINSSFRFEEIESDSACGFWIVWYLKRNFNFINSQEILQSYLY